MPRFVTFLGIILPAACGESDRGQEAVTVADLTRDPLNLGGRNMAGDEFPLSGTVEPGGVATFTLTGAPQLGNTGDEILLVDDGGETVHRVSYGGEMSRAGAVVVFLP
jgi:hypothetical protein